MKIGNVIAGKESSGGTEILQSVNPSTQAKLPEEFVVATKAEITRAVHEAHEAWKIYKKVSGKDKAIFLRTIAEEIENLGDQLVQRAVAESGLPEGRITGERGRTCNQLRLFADLVEEGSWVDAVIDEAIPDRKPFPRVDIRKTSVALGPIVVFTASNFPLAFSTAGGDTASALAAGCPVIVKSHPSHLGTNNLISEAITTAVEKCNLPKGTFSTVQGSIETGQSLVQEPLVSAVGFTGSYKGGKAIFDLANQRPNPIPVYAEMGSVNPIFILQETLEADHKGMAQTIVNSVNLGAGQFCTNPGILVVEETDATNAFLTDLEHEFDGRAASTMLNEGIYKNYEKNKKTMIGSTGVESIVENKDDEGNWCGSPALAKVTAQQFIQNSDLHEEVFGPFTMAVVCKDAGEVHAVAEHLEGQLTASIMGTDSEIANAGDLLETLSQKAGRVIINNVPTGVEVCHAMHHGGPFPSTSNSLYTSVGTGAIKRFVRPVAYQNTPASLLPEELKPDNPLGIWRTVNGEKTK